MPCNIVLSEILKILRNQESFLKCKKSLPEKVKGCKVVHDQAGRRRKRVLFLDEFRPTLEFLQQKLEGRERLVPQSRLV
jgi:hypothetical protein